MYFINMCTTNLVSSFTFYLLFYLISEFLLVVKTKMFNIPLIQDNITKKIYIIGKSILSLQFNTIKKRQFKIVYAIV